MNTVPASLAGSPHPFCFSSFSALDRYFRIHDAPIGFIDTEATQAELARLFDGIAYPGLEYGDALVREGDTLWYFRCIDSLATPHPGAWSVLTLRYDPVRKVFLDKEGIYPVLRGRGSLGRSRPDADQGQALFEAAVLAARYPFQPELPQDFRLPRDIPPAFQADLLTLILTGDHPGPAFDILGKSGFIERYWPELSALASVGQSKEYHPEGNAWTHTLETFRYRKVPDLLLSLALLLHDTGKSIATSNEGRRFDGHAELGVVEARRFLERIGFPSRTVADVCFLIRYHMVPAALPVLPFYRVKDCVESPLFPRLLELYRCDLMSTYRGPEGYYAACTTYKAYLKNAKNPFRGPDGKKELRLFVE